MSITEAAASVAARAFFYPSLAWNIARSRLQDTWHWWDEITPNVILGAIPFYSTLEELKKLGVQAVVTLNETFEVFITTEQYQDSGFQHLHIPTVDFLYAPPLEHLHRGADFIHEIAAKGMKTYVHCKAGRGRSTTLVLCYLIKYLGEDPEGAYAFVRGKRPQVYLAQGQWTAVCGFWVSCHPDKGYKAENFPYPTFLPLAAGKQGSDGPEGNMENYDEAEDCLKNSPSLEDEKAISVEAEPEQQSAETPLDRQIEANASGEEPGNSQSESTAFASGLESHIRQTDSSSETVSGGNSGSSHTNASSQGLDGDGLLLLSSIGSANGSTSDSELSFGGLATALSSCCIHPRRQTVTPSSDSQDPDLPKRAASPAIEIPRCHSPPAKSPSGTAVLSSASGPSSIALEPSGSLPGYIRIAPGGTSTSLQKDKPVMQATLSSTGFVPIDDWADVGYNYLRNG